MKEIVKIERFLEVLKDIWENQKWQIELEGFSRYSEFTILVSPDFGNYPDLIDFETELLTVDEKLIKDKIKNINSICEKMRKDYDFVMQNRKIEKFYPIGSKKENLASTTHATVYGLAPTYNRDDAKKLHFDDNDLINTIEKIKTIIKKINVADNEAPEADNETPKRDLSKFDELFVMTISEKQKEKFKKDIDNFVDGYTKNQIVALALVLHDSVHKRVRPKDFKKWLELFCAIIGKETPTAKQSKPEVKAEIPEMTKAYYYLFH